MNPQLLLEENEMRALGYKVIDMIVDHTVNVHNKSATNRKTRKELEAIFREPIPRTGMSFDILLNQIEEDILGNIMHNDHSRFFAFVPIPSNYVSALAEFLSIGFNVVCTGWIDGSAPGQIELVTIKWLTDLFRLPDHAGGLFISGGAMGNLKGVLLAIHHKKQKGKVSTIYFSNQTHASVHRAIRVLGTEEVIYREIPTDGQFRIQLEQLQAYIQKDKEAGFQPIAIVANCGTTNTGSVDDLKAIGAICQQENLWYHIDAAYGSAGILDDRKGPLYEGIEQADSITANPHKWWFQPNETACLLVRDASTLLDVFYMNPEYLNDMISENEEVNFVNYGIQLTRSFRAFKLWTSLKVFGLDSFVQAVKHGINMAEFAAEEVKKYKHWVVIVPPELAIISFQFQAPNLNHEQTNLLNKSIIDGIVESKFAMISSTELQGQLVVRLCTINPRTTKDDIAATIRRLNIIANKKYQEFLDTKMNKLYEVTKN